MYYAAILLTHSSLFFPVLLSLLYCGFLSLWSQNYTFNIVSSVSIQQSSLFRMFLPSWRFWITVAMSSLSIIQGQLLIWISSSHWASQLYSSSYQMFLQEDFHSGELTSTIFAAPPVLFSLSVHCCLALLALNFSFSPLTLMFLTGGFSNLWFVGWSVCNWVFSFGHLQTLLLLYFPLTDGETSIYAIVIASIFKSCKR